MKRNCAKLMLSVGVQVEAAEDSVEATTWRKELSSSCRTEDSGSPMGDVESSDELISRRKMHVLSLCELNWLDWQSDNACLVINN